MAINSKKELLEWLALKPRTEGWGAVVAYNRKKCNDLLLQDYIQKFTTDSYLPPIREPVPTGDANWELLHDWVTTQPRLSFENSSKTAGGEARMTMAVVGGSQVSIDGVLGHNRAIAIKSLDALDYPELIAEDVALSKTSGTVGKDTGEVVLDLGDAVTAKGMWELTFANSQQERRKGGAFFKKYYRNADPVKRLYHLGKIAYTDQQYLKPQSFILRTTTAPGAASHGSSNFGDGSVELFVCMQGDMEGGTPPRDDWRSLIPDEDTSQTFDTTVLLAHSLIIRKIIIRDIVDMFHTANESDLRQIIDPRTQFISLEGLSETSTMWLSDSTTYITENYKFRLYGIGIPLRIDENHYLTLTRPTTEGIRLKIGGNTRRNDAIRLLIHRKSDNGLHADTFIEAFINVEGDYHVKIASLTNALELGLGNVHLDLRLEAFYTSIPDEVKDVVGRPWSGPGVSEEIRTKILYSLGRFFGKVKEIDAFVLHSILFNDADQVKLKEGYLPGDLVAFGQIGSLFNITSQDHLMGHGATHPFKVSPDFTGNVKWSVRTVPGSTGASGSINADTGVYTSPSINDIDGTYTRVIVTATDTSSTFSSSTLVTVVVRDITVNPVVQICSASPASPGAPVTRTLSANTLGEGVLEWRVIKGEGSIPLRAGPDGKNVYTAGTKNNDLEGSFTVDEIEVKNLATGKAQVAYVLVNHFPQDLKMMIDMEQSSFPAGKAKLKVTDNRDRPVTAELVVVAGNGRVDSSGMYTSDPNSAHRFSLVKATRDYDDTWILLTYPLIELPDKPIDDLENY